MVQVLSRAFSTRTLFILVPGLRPGGALSFPESRLPTSPTRSAIVRLSHRLRRTGRRCDCRSFPISKVRQAPHGTDAFFCFIPSPASAGYWATFTDSLPASRRRRFARAWPSYCGHRNSKSEGVLRATADKPAKFSPQLRFSAAMP